VDCFKQFCLMAGTPRGKQVRLHYLEIEKKFKAAQAALATSGSHNALSITLVPVRGNAPLRFIL
jgi:hypothetical protein